MSDWRPHIVIQKPKSRICGQTCVAMITGLPIDVVINEFGHSHGTYAEEVIQSLWMLGYDNSRQYEKYNGFLPELCIVGVNKRLGGRHWCIYYKGNIYDTNGYDWECSKENLKIVGYTIKSFITVVIPVLKSY